ncbi:hypothetical protein VTK56DRAFT_6458 [Thermocarpiscus australiensis]
MAARPSASSFEWKGCAVPGYDKRSLGGYGLTLRRHLSHYDGGTFPGVFTLRTVFRPIFTDWHPAWSPAP